MLIDWFTVGAQVINFLILIALLKYFLYGRIVKAMDERKERIASKSSAAEEKRKQAEEEAAKYERKNSEFEKERDKLLKEAREEAERRRETLLDEAAGEVDEKRRRWQESLEREQSDFLSALRRKTADSVGQIARRALEDLSSQDLETATAEVFTHKLRELEDGGWKEIEDALAQHEDGKVVLHSGFELPEDTRKNLGKLLQDRLGDVTLDYKTGLEGGWGVELRAGGHKVGWSLDDYLEELEAAFSEELKQRASRPDEDSGNGDENDTRRQDDTGGQDSAGEEGERAEEAKSARDE